MPMNAREAVDLLRETEIRSECQVTQVRQARAGEASHRAGNGRGSCGGAAGFTSRYPGRRGAMAADHCETPMGRHKQNIRQRAPGDIRLTRGRDEGEGMAQQVID